jgi:hypothetical protein
VPEVDLRQAWDAMRDLVQNVGLWNALREILQTVGALAALFFLFRRELHRVTVTDDIVVYAQLIGHEAYPPHGEYLGALRNDARDVQIRSAYVDAGHGYSPLHGKLPVTLKRDEVLEFSADADEVQTNDAHIADAFDWVRMTDDDLVKARVVFVCSRGHDHAKSLDNGARQRVRDFITQRAANAAAPS